MSQVQECMGSLTLGSKAGFVEILSSTPFLGYFWQNCFTIKQIRKYRNEIEKFSIKILASGFEFVRDDYFSILRRKKLKCGIIITLSINTYIRIKLDDGIKQVRTMTQAALACKQVYCEGLCLEYAICAG